MFFRLKNNRGIIFISFNLRGTNLGATAEYSATIVLDSTSAHIFKERETCRNKLSQVTGYSAVTNLLHIQDFVVQFTSKLLNFSMYFPEAKIFLSKDV